MPLWKGVAWMEQPSPWEYDKGVSILLWLALCFPSMVPSHYTTLFHQDLLHTFCLGSAHSNGYRWPCTKNSENKNQHKPLFSSSFELFLSAPYHNRKLTDLSPRKLLFYLFANSCMYLPPMCVHVCRDTWVEVSFSLPPSGFWGGALGRCAWKQTFLLSDPSP